MKTIIILSTRQIKAFLGFIKKQRSFHYVLVCCPDEAETINALELKKYFNEIHYVNTVKSDNILSTYEYQAVKAIIDSLKQKTEQPNLYIYTQDESNTHTVAKLNDAIGISNNTYQRALNFRDKERMKLLLNENNLRVPRYLSLGKKRFNELSSKLGLPFIIKPSCSAGSDGVYKIKSEQDFNEFIKKKRFTEERFEAEEYINGHLYHIDTVIYDGKVHFAYACEYTFGNLEFQQGKVNGSTCLPLNSSLSKRLIDFTLECLQALNCLDGCQHTEIFINQKDELIFLESAARGPGLDISEIYRTNFGISPHELHLYLATGLKPPLIYPYKNKQHSFWVTIPKIKGQVKSLREPILESDYRLQWKVKVSDQLEQATSNLDVAGTLFVSNHDANILSNDFIKIRQYDGIVVDKVGSRHE